MVAKKQMQLVGVPNPDEKGYLFESAIQADHSGIWAKTKRTKSEAFGWDVFNDDSLYRAHAKRTKRVEQELRDNPEMYETMTEEERLERMAEEIEG